MDPRLLEAAQKGDVALLNDLIRSNALILEEAALQGDGNTPLHVACVGGHSYFIRELLKFMPKLAEKVNADGFSPLHIAAARGDVETVREILKAGRPQHLCLVKGREGRIPLHGATTNGEVGAMKELLSASPESVEETTAREETALHLSVKNNRFDALVVLVEHLKQHNKEQVINWKDKKGNTILHLAAAANNFEVVDFMLGGHALKREVLEVNALNESGSTPLDVSSDLEIGEILMRAGAKHGPSNSPSSQIILVDDKEGQKLPHSQSNLPSSQVKGQKSPDDGSSDLLVVAALIATTTTQFVTQPITLFKKLEMHSNNKFLAPYYSFLSGPVWANLTLGSYLITNTMGFFSSVLMILLLTKRLPLRLPLMFSIYSMVGTYLSCLENVPSRSLRDEHFSPQAATLITYLAILIPTVFVLIIAWQQKWLERMQETIAREGPPQSGFQKICFTIFRRLGLVDAPRNVTRGRRPN